MIQSKIHENIMKNADTVTSWFQSKGQGLKFPIYSSFDVRDSGWKVAPVDANMFPAGFNNICHVDKENAPEILKKYIQAHYELNSQRIGLLTEEHTGNSYYWENVFTLSELIKSAGFEPIVGIPSELAAPKEFITPKGSPLLVHGTKRRDSQIWFGDYPIEFVISNNDFSSVYESWSDDLGAAINPPKEMGWYNRRKNSFFDQYNLLAQEFAELIKIDPLDLQIQTRLFSHFDVFDPENLESLALKVDEFLGELKSIYEKKGITAAPFCFVKNNLGTYGLGVTQVHSGEEIRSWNNKTRKKMRASKGGQEVTSVIIQEGIPTVHKDESGATAEPCIYLIGDQLVGGFLRTHAEKTNEESLNSPGAVFKRLCMSDLIIDCPGCPMENVYGWTSKLSALALALEARAAHVEFKGYLN